MKLFRPAQCVSSTAKFGKRLPGTTRESPCQPTLAGTLGPSGFIVYLVSARKPLYRSFPVTRPHFRASCSPISSRKMPDLGWGRWWTGPDLRDAAIGRRSRLLGERVQRLKCATPPPIRRRVVCVVSWRPAPAVAGAAPGGAGSPPAPRNNEALGAARSDR